MELLISLSNSPKPVVNERILMLIISPPGAMTNLSVTFHAKPGFIFRYLLYTCRSPGVRLQMSFITSDAEREEDPVPTSISLGDGGRKLPFRDLGSRAPTEPPIKLAKDSSIPPLPPDPKPVVTRIAGVFTHVFGVYDLQNSPKIYSKLEQNFFGKKP